MKYSDNQLKALANTNPKELVRILSSPHTDTNTLTFGIEILGGEVDDESLVLPVLKKLLKHINAIVREGAVIGVQAFYIKSKPPQEILDRLTVMSSSDPSPAIKDLTQDLLKDYNERN